MFPNFIKNRIKLCRKNAYYLCWSYENSTITIAQTTQALQTYLLGTDASGNVVKKLTTPSPITSQAASLYDLIPNGAFTTTYAFTSTAGTYAKVMQGDDVITANGTYTVQMFVSDYAVAERNTQKHILE